MQRRDFLQLAGIAGAGGLVGLERSVAHQHLVTTVFHVKGFSCVTCAVGLDTLLKSEKGIASSHSTYPGGIVTVSYDPKAVDQPAIEAFISSMGFMVNNVEEAS